MHTPGTESFRDHVKNTMWDMCNPDNELYERLSSDDNLIDRIVDTYDKPFSESQESLDDLIYTIKWMTMEK